MQTRDIPDSDTIDKDNWRRSNHSLAILTTGQVMFISGESQQNPHVMLEGALVMLTVVAPLYTEAKTLETPRLIGISTVKYQKYQQRIARVRRLINASMAVKTNERYPLLQLAYSGAHEIGMDVIQDASSMGFDFKPKLDPSEAYKG